MRIAALIAFVGVLLFAGSFALHSNSRAETNLNGYHWAHGTTPARIGVMVADNLDRNLIANVVREYDLRLVNIELGVVDERPSAGMCAQPQATETRYGYIAVCRWEYGSGGADGLTACPFETYAGCELHHGWGRLSLPRANYPYYPNMICHELGHALGLAHGGDGCMNANFPWAERNKAYCPGANDLAGLDALHAHADHEPSYTIAPFTVAGQDYGCPLPPFYDDGSGQEWTPTPVATNTPLPTSTPSPISTPTPCLPRTAKKCR